MSPGRRPRPAGIEQEREATAALLMRLRAHGTQNLDVLRAMEAVPRRAFVARRYAEHAMRDMALPLACGQMMARPSFVARCLDALGCGRGHRVLEVGVGSGFVTALLATLGADVLGLERYRTLAEEAAQRLHERSLATATVVWADGLSPVADPDRFDRILLHAAVPARPGCLLDRLAPQGVLVYPLAEGGGQRLMRAVRGSEAGVSEEAVCPARLTLAAFGRSAEL